MDRILGVPPGEGLIVLDELADLGLLERELVDRIRLCPACSHCHLNLRETCPDCGSVDLDPEARIHHFACGFRGLESEFAVGIDFVCPSCNQLLERRDKEYELTAETTACRGCGALITNAHVEGQCLDCQHATPEAELIAVDIYSYNPRKRAQRAVRSGRLTNLNEE